jgi:hypothetical protein
MQGDAVKRCLDRIRHANEYPLSREIAKNGQPTRLYNHPGTKQIRDAIERRNQLVQ